ncbi:MAG: DUF86 domain-containing protein [Candidatus Omnitrophota bacterium]|nr:DUF86 domain-containing protein [Candidatus Omnitrophota bacterium]
MPRDAIVYLEDILQAIERIRQYTEGYDLSKFKNDMRTADAVVRNLEILGEAVKKLPDETRSKQPHIEWVKIGSLRDILIHEYFGVDLDILWDVVTSKLPALEQAVMKLLEPPA